MVYDTATKCLYFVPGTNTRQFWKFDTETGSWETLPPVPLGGGKNLKGGTGMAYLNGIVYLLKGSKTKEFYGYNTATGEWLQTLQLPPEGAYTGKGYGDGSCLIAYDDSTLYLLRGRYNEFYKYDILANSWSAESIMPFSHPMWGKKKKVGEGGSMTLKGGKIYAFKGSNTKEFWMFDPGTGKWTAKDTIPRGPEKKYVKGGGGLATFDGTIYALKGNNTTAIYKYTGTEAILATLPNIGTQGYLTGTKSLGLLIKPNPTKGLTNVYYHLPRKEIATLKVYNTLGALVYSERSDKGHFTIKKLPVGIYLLRFSAKGYKEERKLIVVK
jgi:hypothetical protein